MILYLLHLVVFYITITSISTANITDDKITLTTYRCLRETLFSGSGIGDGSNNYDLIHYCTFLYI